MASDMDIDMDLDYEPLPEEQEQILENGEIQPEIVTTTSEIPAAYTDLTLDIQSTKVHIRGLDEASTNDVREFAKEYFTLAEPTRIEWIDDTSANILYSTNEFASKALEAFTVDPLNPSITANPLDPRVSKPMPSKPESMLQVRPALFSDKKKARAHEASRFYMMHPEHDPRERMRVERHRGGRAGSENGDYRRNRYDDREHQRRRDKDALGGQGADFDASMYDDDDGGRQRNRSASPGGASRDSRDSHSRYRSRRSPPRRLETNASKELFPSSKSASRETTNGESLLQRERDAPPKRELFPEAVIVNKNIAKNLKKDLFPHKTTVSNHRRTDAWDAAANETADLFSRKMSTPFTDGARELFPDDTSTKGLSIKGSAGMSIKGGAGLTIKGRGAGATGTREVKELFPERYNGNGNRNQGKELFNDVLEGRGAARRRAEDMFG